MKFLKFMVVILTMFACSVFTYGYLNEKEVIDTIINFYEKNPSTLYNNEYRKEDDVSFVKLTNDFNADSKEKLQNIYYTILSSGMKEFTFYCDEKYIDCINDVVKINNDAVLLSQMNNFVNVFNSFKSIKTTYTTRGKITVSVNRIYNNEDINIINEKVKEIENSIYTDSMNEYDKIKAIHDYIVNNTKYNEDDEHTPNTLSSTAVGVFVNNLATCNGYTDAIAILLDRQNIKNVRVSNDNHIWNLIYLNGKWLHLDATWDDPVNNINEDILSHDYFLKTTQEFDQMGKLKPENEHKFNKEIFKFAN